MCDVDFVQQREPPSVQMTMPAKLFNGKVAKFLRIMNLTENNCSKELELQADSVCTTVW